MDWAHFTAHAACIGLTLGCPKKRPELSITIATRTLYGAKFPLAHLKIRMYCYLFINFSDVINDVTECRIMT